MGNNRRVIGVVTALALVVACALALTGCGSAQASEQDSGKPRVAMVLNDSISDGGWGTSAYQAMIDAANDMGWDTSYSENVAQSDWTTVMQNYCDEGYDLVFAPSGQFDDAVQQVAADNPDTHFCILSSHVQADNIESMLPDSDEIGALAGALAGLLSKSGKVAFVGGVELDTTVAKAAAYERAAKVVNPNAEVTVVYAGSYSDVAKGKELASSLVSGGTDVIYGDASAVDSGVRETLAEHAGTCNIGQPSDLGGADDAVIANSVVTDNKVLIEECMKDVESDAFGNKTVMGTIDNGAIKMGTFSDAIVSQDVQAKFAEYEKQIADGTLGQ